MDVMRLRWLSRALRELDRHYEFIAIENPKAAKGVFTRLKDATEKLRRFPELGRLSQVPGTRELVLTNMPYIIVYRIAEDEVQVLRILHASMNNTLAMNQ
jgi:toxin ParE1/3/4